MVVEILYKYYYTIIIIRGRNKIYNLKYINL